MAPVATAVLVLIGEDGKPECFTLPPFVAEAIAAAERARRDAEPAEPDRPSHPGEALEALGEAQGGQP